MHTDEGILRDIARLIVWFPFRWVIQAVPVSVGFFTFKVLGNIHYFLSPKKKEYILKNLSLALSRHNFGKDTVRRYMENHYVDRLHIFLYPKFNKTNIDKFITFKGLEYLDQTLLNGKGCILVHGHFGPAQLPLFALGLKGYNINQLGLPSDEGLSLVGEKVAFKIRQVYEAMIPAKIISADSFLRPLFKHLEANGILMMTGDGRGGDRFVGKFLPAKFFNQEVLFPTGYAALSLKTGTPILPLFTFRKRFNRFEAVIGKPFQIENTFDNRNRAMQIITQFVKLFEEYVQKYPCHWHFWDKFEKLRISETIQPRIETEGSK